MSPVDLSPAAAPESQSLGPRPPRATVASKEEALQQECRTRAKVIIEALEDELEIATNPTPGGDCSMITVLP